MDKTKEIERKFLVKQLPDNLDSIKGKSIKQGYIYSNEMFEIRLRKKGNKYFQTIKEGKGLQRNEFEIELTESQYLSLWNATEGKRIEKKRYEIKYEDLIIELDIFEASLLGLQVVEVEFEHENLANGFEKPSWFGEEITYDENYKNKNLAINGLP